MADPKAPDPVTVHGDMAIVGEYFAVKVHVNRNGITEASALFTLDELRALLSAHGLHIVSEADRKVLDQLDKLTRDDVLTIAKDPSLPMCWLGQLLLKRRTP